MNERERILNMVAEKLLSVDEAMERIAALDEAEVAAASVSVLKPEMPPRPQRPASPPSPKTSPRYLRIIVKACEPEEGKNTDVDVDVCLPLAMARAIGPSLGNLIPGNVQGQLKDQGVDLAGFDLRALLDGLGEMEGRDIVNINVADHQEGQRVKVNIYVE